MMRLVAGTEALAESLRALGWTSAKSRPSFPRRATSSVEVQRVRHTLRGCATTRVCGPLVAVGAIDLEIQLHRFKSGQCR